MDKWQSNLLNLMNLSYLPKTCPQTATEGRAVPSAKTLAIVAKPTYPYTYNLVLPYGGRGAARKRKRKDKTKTDRTVKNKEGQVMRCR